TANAAFLRAPVERYSTLVASIVACGLWQFPNELGLTMMWAQGLSGLLLAWGLRRFYQGWQVVSYQWHLTALCADMRRSADIPVSADRLFLGRGFAWQTLHTQRLRAFVTQAHQHGWSYRVIRLMQRWLSGRKSQLDVGGQPALHGVSRKENDVWMNLSDRSGHLLVVGTTGVGKTRFAEVLLNQDIRRGDVVILIDPKGDVDVLRRMVLEATLAGRKDDLRIMHLGFAKVSARYNPIGQFTRLTEVANRIANQLPGGGNSAAFKEFGWKFVNTITKALVAMGVRPTYRTLHGYIHRMERLLTDYVQTTADPSAFEWVARYKQRQQGEGKEGAQLTQKAWMAYVKAHALAQDAVVADLLKACEYDKTYFDKITASLSPLLDKLTSGQAASLLSPDYANDADARPILDWMQVIRHRQIVYVGLDALTDATIATAVGNAMLADLVSVAGRLYNRGAEEGLAPSMRCGFAPIINLHVDEANEVIGNEFVPILNKARGAGFRVTAYTQTLSDIEARLESLAKTGQVVGNLGTVVMFRVKEARTAQLLVEQLPKVNVHQYVQVSSANDLPHPDQGVYFSSHNEDRLMLQEVPMLEVADVLNLPKGQAFALLEGGQLYKLRMPLPMFEPLMLPQETETLIAWAQGLFKEDG
nr:type IV conjugative transfer system coupling protein TraD [Legionellales bacterium]